MKSHKIVVIIAFLLICKSAFGQFNEAIETNLDGLTGKLIICQQDLYKLYIKVEFENSTMQDIVAGRPIYFKEIYVLDPENDKKYFVLKDADGCFLAGPCSDANEGGRWWINVPAQGKVTLWAMFSSLPHEVKVVDVVIPELFPFENIELKTEPFISVKEHATNAYPNSVTLISAKRSRGAVSVRLQLSNTGSVAAKTGAIFYRDAYLYDYINQRKYPVLKDSDNHYIAEPKSDLNDGGRWWSSSLKPGGRQLMSLKFQAPPDDVNEVTVVVPLLVPFEKIELSGKGGVEDHSGLQVIGAESGIKKVLKNLQAEETEDEITLKLSSEVLFDHDKWEIRTDAESVLNDVLTVIQQYADSNVRIEGHTDSTGSDDYNKSLSERRAEAVKSWLVDHGANADKLKTKGFGETQPVVSNDTAEGRQKNRRVELVIEK
ncbi:MAG: OmpA family protein [Candidatus Aerophobetes bacterium]|nr:OmpA family protein [Candidatus Aerophobetes bacterium]